MNSPAKPGAGWLAHAWTPVLILVGLNLVIGWLTVRDYGESWDERRRLRYGQQSLQAYLGPAQIDATLVEDEKGPAYVMLASLLTRLLTRLQPGWETMQAFHFVHFLSFQVGVVSLYAIARRLLSPGAALGAAVLFSTQPLLWGHAFINPKDLPFMAFFCASLAIGLSMVERFSTRVLPEVPDSLPATPPGEARRLIRGDWQASPPRRRWLFRLLGGGLLLILALATIGQGLVRAWIAGAVRLVYFAPPASPLGALFARLAQSPPQPVENYIQKALAYAPWLSGAGIGLALLAGALLAAWMFPAWAGWLWRSGARPALAPRFWLAHLRQAVRQPALYAAAGLLGFTAAIRILGPAAGLLVALVFLFKAGRRALPALLLYFLLAGGVMVLAWPGMWGSPLETLAGSLQKAADFPWGSKVRFAGLDYFPEELPPGYLPVLLAIQLSEPAVALFLGGLLAALRQFGREPGLRGLLLAVGLWFLAPLGLVMALRPSMYDNFRHFLFILPPVFIFAGYALEEIFRRLGRLALAGGLLILLLLPGIFWLTRLHPFQYVYYNSLVGGVGGAFRRYELDYWATAYRQAVDYLNASAPQGARVVVEPPVQLVSGYARPDLSVVRLDRDAAEGGQAFDYAVLPTRNDKDVKFYPDAPAAFQAGRDGAVFVVVKRLR